MGNFVGHEPCSECGSSDALARYDDGSAYCFKCEYHEKATNEEVRVEKPQPVDTRFLRGSYEDLPKRKIKADTCRALDYQIGTYNGTTCHIAPIHNDRG